MQAHLNLAELAVCFWASKWTLSKTSEYANKLRRDKLMYVLFVSFAGVHKLDELFDQSFAATDGDVDAKPKDLQGAKKTLGCPFALSHESEEIQPR